MIDATKSIILSQQDRDLVSTMHSSSFKGLDAIAKETNQVFITMPDKAAGTTLMHFTRTCMNQDNLIGDYINFREKIENIITQNYRAPSIIASHIHSDTPFIDILKGSTRESLIIYIHREELSRVRSAAQHILISRLCAYHELGKKLMNKYYFNVELNGTRCTIDEEHMISIIKNRDQEVGVGAPELLTCEFFDEITQNTPSNLVFVDYKQASKLQRILAKYHCPHITKDLPIAMNVASQKTFEPFIRLKTNTSRIITFDDWFDNKQNLILWALKSNAKMNCKSKMLDMEDHLFSCPNEAVTLLHGEFHCISLYE
jgi:hypothetical protein